MSNEFCKYFCFDWRRNNTYSNGQMSQELSQINSYSPSSKDNIKNNFNCGTQPSMESYHKGISPHIQNYFDDYQGKIDLKEDNNTNNFYYEKIDESTEFSSGSCVNGRNVYSSVDKESVQTSEEKSYKDVINSDDIEMEDCCSPSPFNCFIGDDIGNLPNIGFFSSNFSFKLTETQNDEISHEEKRKIPNPYILEKIAKLTIPVKLFYK